jgi:hypothetical protein
MVVVAATRSADALGCPRRWQTTIEADLRLGHPHGVTGLNRVIDLDRVARLD